MKNNSLGFLGFGLVCVIVIAATGNYIFALPADFFFLVAIHCRGSSKAPEHRR